MWRREVKDGKAWQGKKRCEEGGERRQKEEGRREEVSSYGAERGDENEIG